MKKEYGIFLLACIVLSSSAKPAVVYLGYQDSLGQYSFGYSAPGSARSEVRTLNGATRGAYSYLDENGVIHSTQYVADSENGFRVVSSNLPEAPVPVQDTAEVVAARAAHLQAVELAREAGESTVEKSGTEETAEGKPEESPQLVEAKNASGEEAEEMPMVEEGDKKEEVQPVNEEPQARTTQEINGVRVPTTIPIYRISYGNDKVEFSLVEDSLKATGSPNTPAETALASNQETAEEPGMTKQAPAEAERMEEKEPEPVYTPVRLLQLSSLPSILRYAPVHYVAYDVV